MVLGLTTAVTSPPRHDDRESPSRGGGGGGDFATATNLAKVRGVSKVTYHERQWVRGCSIDLVMTTTTITGKSNKWASLTGVVATFSHPFHSFWLLVAISGLGAFGVL